MNCIIEKSFERLIREAAYQAGIALYGLDLVYRNSEVKIRNLSDRIKEQLEECVDPSVAGCVDDYEYAFTEDHLGIEASGETLTNPDLHNEGLLCLYDPEFGIDVLKVDMTTEQMFKYINACKG